MHTNLTILILLNDIITTNIYDNNSLVYERIERVHKGIHAARYYKPLLVSV